MVVDPEWETVGKDTAVCTGEEADQKGKYNRRTGTFVPNESLFRYALEQCAGFSPYKIHELDWNGDFRKMMVEWFYSDDEWTDTECHGGPA